MRLIDADALIDELQKDEAKFDKEAEDAQNDPSYTEGYSDAMWSRANGIRDAIIEIYDAPTIDAVSEWIPCSERLPEDIRPVLVTWKNTDPASYYQYIVGKHFIGTAHYHRGKWYWYSSVTEDLLAEYGKCDSEEFDEAIKAVAWMPLPEPWKGADDGDNNQML